MACKSSFSNRDSCSVCKIPPLLLWAIWAQGEFKSGIGGGWCEQLFYLSNCFIRREVSLRSTIRCWWIGENIDFSVHVITVPSVCSNLILVTRVDFWSYPRWQMITLCDYVLHFIETFQMYFKWTRCNRLTSVSRISTTQCFSASWKCKQRNRSWGWQQTSVDWCDLINDILICSDTPRLSCTLTFRQIWNFNLRYGSYKNCCLCGFRWKVTNRKTHVYLKWAVSLWQAEIHFVRSLGSAFHVV